MATISAKDFFKNGTKAEVVAPASQSLPTKSDNSSTPSYFQRVMGQYKSAGDSITKDFQNNNIDRAPLTALHTVGSIAKAAFAPITEAISPTVNKLVDKISDQPKVQESAMNGANAKILKIADRVKAFAEKHPELARSADDLYNIANLLTGAKVDSKISTAASDLKSSIKGAVTTIDDAAENIKPRVIAETLKDKFTSPGVSEATKVSLNPKEALKGSLEDPIISIGGKGKKLSELTLDENSKLKQSTTKAYEKFTTEAKKFMKNRNPLNDPTEIVGQRVDKALSFADAKRQRIGSKMGEIEQKYTDTPLEVSEKTIKPFLEIVDEMNGSRYGMDTGGREVMQTLIENFDKLNENGATIGERLDFVRRWDKYLDDAKDPYGNFKENGNVNRQVQNAVRTLKNETLDEIAKSDKTYRKLRRSYAVFKELDRVGNTLLGKDGLLGDRIKGGATVKRALKSNSDAGARQFLIKLKELTGYDALKDGDLALTAMESVGDFQGLSLLEVLKQGKSGIINRVLEKAQDKLVGDKATRVKKYISK